MSACCNAGRERKAPPRARRMWELLAWLLPSAAVVLLPKCPACLAAYVTLWTGLGLSFAAATWLRWLLLGLCTASLLVLTRERLGGSGAIFRRFKQETESCRTR